MTLAGLVLNGVLGLFNLLLVMLVARRVRLAAARQLLPRPWLAPGTPVPDFEGTTIDGKLVALSQLRGKRALVGFFSVGCEPCREQVPLFAMFLTGDQAPDFGLAVIVDGGVVVGSNDAATFTEQLAGKVPVVHEAQGGPLVTAFSARAFPALYLLDPNGVVAASGPGLGAIVGTSQSPALVPR